MVGVFEELGTAVETLDIPLDGDALAAAIALRDRFEARISDAVNAYDRAGLWELDGATSMTGWLADRGGMARARAAASAARARKLARLSVTPRAWRDGVLSGGQVGPSPPTSTPPPSSCSRRTRPRSCPPSSTCHPPT
jgi:hypothetical protein